MDAPAHRSFTATRIVALALIVLAVLGLVYLRVASGSDPVSVPKGAHAGQLTLHSCTYATEKGSYAADCGTLVVPENRHDSHSRLIALPVKRIRALSANPREPVFRLQGGPGLTNMDFKIASRYAADRDVVLVGYRGVDSSTVLDCPEVVSAMKHARDLIGQAYFDSAGRAYGTCAHRLQGDGVDLAGYSLPQRVDDLEAARLALGYHKVDLLSESAGTRTALIYAERYPKSIHRNVMVGVNPPGNFVWYPQITDEQIHKYAAICARQESCSSRTSDLAATFAATARDIPDRWGFLRIKPGNARIGSFFGLMSSTEAAAPISSPRTIDTWLAASKGDASGLWFLSTLSQLAFPDVQVKGDAAAVARTDARYARRYFASERGRPSILGGSPGSDFIWAGGQLLDGWPANPDENEYGRVQDSNVETLLIGGNLDFATPAQTATRQLLPHLPNGRQVILPGLGHTDDFWDYEPRASSRLINTYLDRGRVDTSLYTVNHVDLTPVFSQTRIAKIVLAVLLGFAGLTVLSLLLLGLRVRRRGGLGRRSSVAIRSAYVLVLGLGGWFIGVLVVLTALPTVPLDSPLLAGLSIGLPVGLGVFLAWVRPELETRAQVIAFAGSLAAALVGAWLGLHAVAGLFGVVSAALGATVGANLTLLGLDIAWDHRRGIPAPERHVLLEEEAGNRHFGGSRLRPRADDPVSTSVVASSHRRTEGGSSMTPTRPHSNLAARMGRWSADHWKTATFGWLALVAVAFAVGGQVGTKQVDPNTAGPGESGRMDRILDAGFKQPASESILIQRRSSGGGGANLDAAVADVVASVSQVPAVQNVHRGRVSPDGRSALVEFELRGDKKDAADKLGPVLDRVDQAQQAHPALFIGEFGESSAAKGVDTAFANDLSSAGALSIPLTLIILVIAFGALVAAGIPLLLALTAVFATFGLASLPSQLLPLAPEAPAVVLLVGLAVGVDYSMFYLRREREERAAGRSERAALEAAAATSGRSVLISGLTVMVAMAGMFLTGDATFASFGYATMIVVAMAMLGSLTVLPALLSRLGDRVDRLRVPLVGRRRGGTDGRVWGAIVERVLRRPLLSAILAGGVLVALALPAAQLRFATPGPDTFPKSLDVVKTYNRMQAAFPGKALPANVVVKVPNLDAPAVRDAIARLRHTDVATGPVTVDRNADGTVADITVPIPGTGTDAASVGALSDLRDRVVPATVGALPNAEAGVTGITAEWNDQLDQMKSKLPLVVGFVLLFAFVLMLVAFRSIVVAFKAIVLNLLSVAAAYGILVLVFQHGFAKGLLGFGSTAGIAPVVPLLLFVILFGLSMDYHVFIVGRIRELFDRGESMDDAIAHGITSTAGVVTSAAIVMVAVFSVFATLSMLMFKQFGLGLAAAILIDATLVRGVLLPATMKLLGEHNWYLPRWLEWLPRLEHDEEEQPTAPPQPAAG